MRVSGCVLYSAIYLCSKVFSSVFLCISALSSLWRDKACSHRALNTSTTGDNMLAFQIPTSNKSHSLCLHTALSHSFAAIHEHTTVTPAWPHVQSFTFLKGIISVCVCSTARDLWNLQQNCQQDYIGWRKQTKQLSSSCCDWIFESLGVQMGGEGARSLTCSHIDLI